jgi:AcrR family transcriptional regulator
MEHEIVETEVEGPTEVIAELSEKPDTENDVLLAALSLFAKKGFYNTSIAEIAVAAGVKNTAAVYHHFKNKQVIAAKLYDNISDSLNFSIDDIRRKNSKSSEQLKGVVNLMFTLADDAPDIMRFLLLMKLDEFLTEEKSMLESPAFVKIQKIIQSGIKAGEIRNLDPLLIYAYFFGIINNILRMVLTDVLEKDASAYQSQAWLSAWNIIAKK